MKVGNSDSSQEEVIDEPSSIDTNDNLETEMCDISLEMCSNAYFAGYLAKSCFDYFKCLKCINKFLKTDDYLDLIDQHEFLIFYKNYKQNDYKQKSMFFKEAY